MQRRAFIALLGGVAGTSLCPGLPRRRQMPVIGFLSMQTPEGSVGFLAALRRSLLEAGIVEGQNATIEYRFARGQYDRLPAMAAELARRPVDLLIAVGGDPAAAAAIAAT